MSDNHYTIQNWPLINTESLAQEWMSLESRSDCPFFLSWNWISSWLKSIKEPVQVLYVKKGNEIVGLALFCERQQQRHKILTIYSLHLNTTGHEDMDVITVEYNNVLTDRRYSESVLNAVYNFLIENDYIHTNRWNELSLRGISANTLPTITKTGLLHEIHTSAPSFFVDLERVRQVDKPYLQQLSRNTRSQLKRSIRLYEKFGELSIHNAESTEEALEYFHAAGELHQKRWVSRGKPGAFAYPFYIQFNENLIRQSFVDGHIQLSCIRAGQHILGYIYNFIYRKRVYYYFSGFNFLDDNKYKPGLVSHYLCIQEHLEDGMDVYDFMAGDNRYKQSFGQPGPEMLTLRLQKHDHLITFVYFLKKIKSYLSGK